MQSYRSRVRSPAIRRYRAASTGCARAPRHRRWLGSPVSPTVSLVLAEAASVPAVPSAEGAESCFSQFPCEVMVLWCGWMRHEVRLIIW